VIDEAVDADGVIPEDAIRAGATPLVVGRPIRDAADPARAARSVLDEVSTAIRSTTS
jgi:orotidine-5'-phosphate decarboxylase